MRVNIWIILAALLALLAITLYLQHQQDMQRICGDDPTLGLSTVRRAIIKRDLSLRGSRDRGA